MFVILIGIIVMCVFDGLLDIVIEGIFKELLVYEVVVYVFGGLFIVMGIFILLLFLLFVFVGGIIIFLGICNKNWIKKEKEDEF